MNMDVQADRSLKINGEINNLIQILNNLIANAIQSYDEKGGMIEIGVMKENSNIKFSIKDSGKGIPMEIQEKLFKSMVTTKGKNGTGLGLYMSYSTIKGHFGGNMWFESEEGKGTTFYITVPLMSEK
jgi:signal transduction histidine kinase